MSAAALPFIAMGVQAIGSIAGGIGANNEAKAAARDDEENARLSILSGEQDSGEVLRQERMAAGDAIAAMSGSGAGLFYGSAGDVLVESQANRDSDIAAIRSRAGAQADNYLQAAKDKRAAGKNALIGSVFSAASNALTSFAGLKGQARVSAASGRVRNAVLGGSNMSAPATGYGRG